MNEKDEIAREVLPFIEDLFPGVSISNVILVVKYLTVALVSAIGIFILFYAVARIFVRHNSERYIKNLEALLSIDNLNADEEKKKQLKNLILQCVILGTKIDFHTNRKNNSKIVSQIVWKMCRKTGIEVETAILYTCASMIYDAGFLDVNSSYFHTEVLSAKEKKLLHSHIMGSYEHLLFIPEEIRNIFFNAAMFHHENYNGTGYPEGLSKNDIPEVAQMIRVAESYVSLISRRSYRLGFSKEEAVNKLIKNSAFYNPEFLSLINKIV